MLWSHIKIIALALLLTVVAHDAVMAGDPHANSQHAYPAHRSDEHSRDHASHHQVSSTVAALTAHDGTMLVAGHDMSCGPVVASRPPAPIEILPDRFAVSFVQPLPADHLPIHAPQLSDDPHHPPDVQRALLQVFLN